MNMLKARLYDFEIKKKDKQNQNLEFTKSEIGCTTKLDHMFYNHIDWLRQSNKF